MAGRFSLKQMMLYIAVAAFGFLALAKNTKPFALLWFDVVLITVFYALLGAIFGKRTSRGRYVGYSFGVAAYFYLMRSAKQSLVTSSVTVPMGKMITGSEAGTVFWGASNYNLGSFNCHLFIAVLVGLLGSFFAHCHQAKCGDRIENGRATPNE